MHGELTMVRLKVVIAGRDWPQVLVVGDQSFFLMKSKQTLIAYLTELRVQEEDFT
ncbi:hypothetical protein MKX03_014737, partial [Papaver bracteatum]